MSRYIYLTIVALFVAGIYTASADERLSVSAARDKQHTVITVNGLAETDRKMLIEVASENVYQSSTRDLSGERQLRIEWRRLPDDGEYVVEVRVVDSMRRVRVSRTRILTLPRA